MKYRRKSVINGIKIEYLTAEQYMKNLKSDLDRELRYSKVADGYDLECCMAKIRSLEKDMDDAEKRLNAKRENPKRTGKELGSGTV